MLKFALALSCIICFAAALNVNTWRDQGLEPDAAVENSADTVPGLEPDAAVEKSADTVEGELETESEKPVDEAVRSEEPVVEEVGLSQEAGHQTAIMNLIRHGEDCRSSSHTLSKIGTVRAEYIGRCMAEKQPSLIMPYGPPHAIFAAHLFKNNSLRPIVTAQPLAMRIGVEIQQPCEHTDELDSLREMAQCESPLILASLRHLGTTNVYMTKHEMAHLKSALKVPEPEESNVHYRKWPDACRSAENRMHPESCDGKSGCFDMVWQVEFTRASDADAWKATEMRRFFQDFYRGTGESHDANEWTCKGDLAPMEPDTDIKQLRRNRKSQLDDHKKKPASTPEA